MPDLHPKTPVSRSETTNNTFHSPESLKQFVFHSLSYVYMQQELSRENLFAHGLLEGSVEPHGFVPLNTNFYKMSFCFKIRCNMEIK